MSKTSKEQALDRFHYNLHECIELTQQIQEHLNNHCDTDPQEINWGHVGSISHTKELLEQVVGFLGISEVE